MDNYIEEKVAEYENRTGIILDVHARSTLRDMLKKEEKFEARREALEEEGHSHSTVGDRYNM